MNVQPAPVEHRSFWQRNGWLVAGAVPLVSWFPAVFAGVRMRRLLPILAGVLLIVATVVGIAWPAHADGSNTPGDGLVGFAWILGVPVGLLFKPAYDRFRANPLLNADNQALLAAQERVAERKKGRELALKQPALAREVGVGQPDKPGARDYGVVDVNAVDAPTLERLPNVDGELAQQIVTVRKTAGAFSSLEELGALCDIPPGTLDGLREYAVFIRGT